MAISYPHDPVPVGLSAELWLAPNRTVTIHGVKEGIWEVESGQLVRELGGGAYQVIISNRNPYVAATFSSWREAMVHGIV